jgi:hypothetical protein
MLELKETIQGIIIYIVHQPKGLKLDRTYIRNAATKAMQVKKPPQKGPQKSQSGISRVSANSVFINYFFVTL